jgi:nitrogen regulatory protein PII
MKTYLDCFPCFLKQALRAGRIATDDEKKIKEVLDEVGMMLKDIPLESTPPESGRVIYHKVAEITGNPDPYEEIKRESTKNALSLYPSLKKQVEKSEDRLLVAIRIAIAGNVIDFGADWDFDMENEVKEALYREGINLMTVSEVKGYGRQKGHTETYRGSEYQIEFVPKIKIEIIVDENKADLVIDSILSVAKTGQVGDGKIFVSTIDEVIRIRTEESGTAAL